MKQTKAKNNVIKKERESNTLNLIILYPIHYEYNLDMLGIQRNPVVEFGRVSVVCQHHPPSKYIVIHLLLKSNELNENYIVIWLNDYIIK